MNSINRILLSSSSVETNEERDEAPALLAKFLGPMPGLVHTDSTSRQRESGSHKVSLKINFTEDFEHTWLADPPANSSSTPGDTIHSWQSSDKTTNYPQVDKNFVPNEFKDYMPRAIPIFIANKKLDDCLSGPALFKNNKATVDSRVFKVSDVKVTNNHFNQIDSMSRKLLIENLVSDTIIDNSLSFMSDTLENWDSIPSDQLKDKFNVLFQSHKILSASSLRLRNLGCSIFTTNKLAVRDEILDSFEGNQDTKVQFRGSVFGHNSVFGPLSESFYTRLHSNPAQAYHITLRPKSNAKFTTGRNSNGPNHSNPPVKRPNNSPNSSYANKRGKFPETTRVSTPQSYNSGNVTDYSNNRRGSQSFRSNSGSKGRGFHKRR